MKYTLNWDGTDLDGTTTLQSGDEKIDVTVTSTANADGQQWMFGFDPGDTNAIQGDPDTVRSSDVSRPVELEIAFDREVSEVSFEIYDVDASAAGAPHLWDDKVSIVALKADGSETEIKLSDLISTHVVTESEFGVRIEGDGNANAGIEGPGAPDSVTVTVPGPVERIKVVHDNGGQADTTGTVGISDVHFATDGDGSDTGGSGPARDGLVHGTDADDIIVAGAYVDEDGDEVDNEDAIIPGDGPNDDRIFGKDGDDIIDGGEARDTIHGGDGDDTIIGGAHQDVIDGEADADTFVLTGAEEDDGDTIHGGNSGNDIDRFDVSALGERGVDWDVEHLTPDGDDAPFDGFDGDLVFLDGKGNETGRLNFKNIEIICFTPGTRIATPTGERCVEDLKAGDQVLTRDNGVQEIAWYGQTGLNAADFAARPHLAPIWIKAGALGNGLPERDMYVSPQHRVLVSSERAAYYFDEREVLVAAKHLVNGTTILQRRVPQTTYVHFMCERHEVVLSNGAWTESFQPGEHSLAGIDSAQRAEILELFPDLAREKGLKDYAAARRTLKRHEAVLLQG